MTKPLARLFCMAVFSLLTRGGLYAQSISIDVANFNTGTYGAGGSITVPIKLSGNFSVSDQFLLYLSDATGSFKNATLIGGYNTFFSPFVNGVLPKGTSGNGYRLKVVLNSVSSKVADSTNAFNISGVGDTVANLTPAYDASIQINDTTFGKCSASGFSVDLQGTEGQKLQLSSVILDSAGKKVTNSNASALVSFPAVAGNYYTVQAVVKNADNSLSIRSFLVMDSYANNNFGQGLPAVCIPTPVTATLSIATYQNNGVLNNYPGTIYSIFLGDSTSVKSITNCRIEPF